MQKESYLLEILIKDCGINRFTIVDKKDLIKESERLSLDENDIDEIMSALERKGKIKIKYDDENVYCVLVVKNEGEEKESKKLSLSKIFILTFFSSFLGSFVATIVSFLIKTLWQHSFSQLNRLLRCQQYSGRYK